MPKAKSTSKPTFQAFQKAFFKGVPKEDISLLSSDDKRQIAEKHLEMLRAYTPGKAQINIYTPSCKGEGLASDVSIIDIVCLDYAFIIDSVVACLRSYGLSIGYLIHPITQFEGDKVSHLHIQLESVFTTDHHEDLKEKLQQVLQDVRLSNMDWKKMLAMLQHCKDNLQQNAPMAQDDVAEAVAFIDYIHDNNFTLLGAKTYKIKGKDYKSAKGALGLFSPKRSAAFLDEEAEKLPLAPHLPQKFRRPLIVTKLSRISTVHRTVLLDCVGIAEYNTKGEQVAEHVFLGLFTSVTYSRSVDTVPLLRQKVANTVQKFGFDYGTHDEKALRHILERYPRDELFQITSQQLADNVQDMLRLQERQKISLFLRQGRFKRFTSCLVYIPKDQFDTHLRVNIQKTLEAELGGSCIDFTSNMDDSTVARVAYIIKLQPGKHSKPDKDKIEKMLQELAEPWAEKLEGRLRHAYDDVQKIARLKYQYGAAFPTYYQEHYTLDDAILDIQKCEDICAGAPIAIDILYPDFEPQCDELHLKIYTRDEPIVLSDVLPILENMGLCIMEEVPFKIKRKDCASTLWMQDFHVAPSSNIDIQLECVKPVFEEAFLKIWAGRVKSDPLNALVLNACMPWRDVRFLRACMKYLWQVKMPYSRTYVAHTLSSHAQTSTKLVAYFKAIFDPPNKAANSKNKNALRDAILADLDNITSLEQDTIFRHFLNLIESMLRTNFFQTDESGAPRDVLSFKLDSKNLLSAPMPRPYREIFVYGVDFEGVHLRGDAIARGGLRWSDRKEDFRTEILGLMKAQQVKNAVIVPMGAKGGFVLKKEFKDRDVFRKKGVEAYKTFVSALLDITDNRKGTKIVAPDNTVRLDGDDPYLVVAADKGTATFSDIANEISQAHDFWLDDAFASGGSQGYDHKAMGITARGAWESVKRHFRELGHDTQSQPFDVIGVGDMGGDVFGNGMLCSQHIRLIAAFNHLHIFIDPDPNTETSFKERQRLFKQVKGWDDYNESYLSKGGRIFDRSKKSLKLTPEIKARFDIKEDELSPPELMKRILKSRADLLWFGGIGTYIKASAETHTEVGDKANDMLRVDAPEVQAKVIGEGANLALTQDARIQLAQQGVALNADFIDNSGGVDCSDHEVNIKILFGQVLRSKSESLTYRRRNNLLEDMTEAVAQAVLRNNYLQAQGISLMKSQSVHVLPDYMQLMSGLEKRENLNREIENLPGNDALLERQQANQSLTRPEIATIQAYAKIDLTNRLMRTKIAKEDFAESILLRYFPQQLQKKYKKHIVQHRLSDAIICTELANHIVNRMGAVFISRIVKKTDAALEDIIKLYMALLDIFDYRAIWDGLESLDSQLPAYQQLMVMAMMRDRMEHTMLWVLQTQNLTTFLKKSDICRGDYAKVRAALQSDIPAALKDAYNHDAQDLMSDGMPEKLAKDVTILDLLTAVMSILTMAESANIDAPKAAQIYYDVSRALELDWLRRQAEFIHPETEWDRQALESLQGRLDMIQSTMVRSILKEKKAPLDSWMEKNKADIKGFKAFIKQLSSAGNLDVSMFIIALERLKQLCK